MKRNEKIEEIKKKYADKGYRHDLFFQNDQYRETGSSLYQLTNVTVNPVEYILRKRVVVFALTAIFIHLIQFLVFYFSDHVSRSNIIQIFFQATSTALCFTFWRDACDRSIQLKIDQDGIRIERFRTFIEWRNVLTTHILSRRAGKSGYRYFLIINYYIPELDVFREIALDLSILEGSVKKVAYQIEYFKHKYILRTKTDN